MLTALWIVPLVAGFLALKLGRRFLLLSAGVHALLTTAALATRPAASGWIQLDALGGLFLALSSLLFLAASFHAQGYLRREVQGARPDLLEGDLFSNAPEGLFCACLLWFLASMSLVCLSHQMTLLWIAVEATTLASAPLIYFHRHHRSLEATWKYLLICSVGLGLALLGNLFLVVAGSELDSPLQLEMLRQGAAAFDPVWLKLSFVLLVVGYGTKMGLAPLHTWLPDTHSEAPSLVSALLSGSLLNCAFLAILRGFQVVSAAGLSLQAQQMLLFFGLASLLVSAVFIAITRDFKRMLAYSSVEHMGILTLGLGLGPAGWFAMLLHAVSHSLVKGGMFMLAGNVMEGFHTRRIGEVHGMLRRMPLTGILWMAGFLALTGSPPFSPFVSEFLLFQAALTHDHPWLAASLVAALAAIFLGMSRSVLGMAQGAGSPREAEPLDALAAPALLLGLSLLLGLALPGPLGAFLHEAAATL